MMDKVKQNLMTAEQRAKDLFNTVEIRGLIVPGKTEKQLNDEVVDLARKQFGIDKFWHKKIVRAGANTMQPYSGNPPDLLIQYDDLVILDFGPIFDGWEADLGRTYVIGNNPVKLKLQSDIEAAWHEAKAWYTKRSSLTGAEYFHYLHDLARSYGWEYAGELGGHIVGHFPHEQLAPDDLGLDIHPDNHADILQRDPQGQERHWILEIHFVDRARQIGGFFEQLLNPNS